METLENTLGFSLDYIPYLLILAGFLFPVFYFVMRIYTNSFMRWEQALRNAAEKTGLSFSNRCDVIMRDPSKAMRAKTYLGLAMRFKLDLDDLVLSGTYRNFSIHIGFETTRGDDSSTSMIIRIFFLSPLSFDLAIRPKNAMLTSIKSIIGKGRISQDTDLDSLIKIYDITPDKAGILLNTADSKKGLFEIFSAYPYAYIDNRGLVLTKSITLMGDKPWDFKNTIDWTINRLNEFHRVASKL